MPEAVIIDALRTPIGNLGGALASIRPDDLAALTIQAIVEKPVHSFFVNAGIYVLSQQALPLIPNDAFFDMPD